MFQETIKVCTGKWLKNHNFLGKTGYDVLQLKICIGPMHQQIVKP